MPETFVCPFCGATNLTSEEIEAHRASHLHISSVRSSEKIEREIRIAKEILEGA